MARVAAYIDGFNLYHGLRAVYRHRYLWLDPVALVRRLRPHDDVVAVRYFTALIMDNPLAQARQEGYLAALAAHCGSRLDVVLGYYRRRTRRCYRCGDVSRTYEEKQTDVNIAISLVDDAVRNTADIAVIISGDGDLCPAISMARRLAAEAGNSLGVMVAFPPSRSSPALRRQVPRAVHLTGPAIRNSLLPDEVQDPWSGVKHCRPDKWR